MVTRIGGLASGMDIDSMVAKLMTAERAPLNKLYQKKQIAEWQRDAYRSINTKMKTFNDYSFDNIILSSNFMKKTASVSGGSSDKVSVKAGAGASGNLEIQQVSQLASNAKTDVVNVSNTQRKIAGENNILSEIGIASQGELKLKITDDKGNATEKTVTFEPTDKISDFVQKLKDVGVSNASFNAATGQISMAGNNVTVISQTNAEVLNFSSNGVSDSQFVDGGQGFGVTPNGSTRLGELGLENGSITLNVIQANGETKQTKISFNKSDTLDSFITSLNRSGAGVTALFSNGKLTMSANNSGEVKGGSTSSIQLLKGDNNDATNMLNALGFGAAPDGKTKDKDGNDIDTFDLTKFGGGTEGQNAKYTINGLDMESTSNLVNVSGYEITLNGEFNKGGIDPANTVSVKSTNDINHMVDKIKEFVNKYNEFIAGINDQLKETKYRSYMPLTDEQRKEMTETEQKMWDEKAKSGLLRSDAMLRQGLSDMRSALGGHVDGLGDNVIDTLAEMGITTTKSYNDGGKLQIDENKLRKALADDPDRVMSTLTQTGEKKADGTDTRGVIVRLRSAMDEFGKKIESKAGRATMTDSQYSIGKNLIDMDKRIDTWKLKLENIESRYWKQFTAMEQAINKANQQSGMFMQFAGGN
ncbi:flagellar filament capping protein FliD [Lysinibacillus capsici]|uniref:flagellar filament capping protein FliD n=1 Tax=Lysinibacillus capsici TaxID=2115968 RepID=UPI0036B1C5D3